MRSRVLALSLLLTVLLVPGPGSAAPSAAKTGPDHHRPKVGVCHDYGIKGLYAISAPKGSVSCDESHRAITVAVPRVSRPIDRAHPAKAFEKAGARCYRAVYRALGGTIEQEALTAYSISYFIPTRAEVEHGARWVRCDLLLYGGTRLLPLPDPYLPAPPDDSVALCLTSATGGATTCERKHRFRAVGTVPVKGDAYPSDGKFNAVGAKKCQDVSDDVDLWRWPNEQAWDAGKHLVTCYTRTRS